MIKHAQNQGRGRRDLQSRRAEQRAQHLHRADVRESRQAFIQRIVEQLAPHRGAIEPAGSQVERRAIGNPLDVERAAMAYRRYHPFMHAEQDLGTAAVVLRKVPPEMQDGAMQCHQSSNVRLTTQARYAGGPKVWIDRAAPPCHIPKSQITQQHGNARGRPALRRSRLCERPARRLSQFEGEFRGDREFRFIVQQFQRGRVQAAQGRERALGQPVLGRGEGAHGIAPLVRWSVSSIE